MKNVNDVYWLVNPDDGAIALDAAQKFWKELIREGRWTNPRAAFTLQVDRGRLERWKHNFDQMLDAGIKVPLPWGHSYDPRDNAGFLEELELRDGDPTGAGLWGLLNIPNDDDAARLGKTVSAVSVSINPSFVDGSGRDWGEVIEHVALTNYPVVTDQGEFIQAATEEGESKRAIMLELASPVAGLDEAGNVATGPGHSTEPESENLQLETRNSELNVRLYQLERERAEREVDDAMRFGKFTRPAAEALRQLLTAGVAARYSFDTAGADIAGLAHDIIANTPPGAAVDMTEHTRLRPMPDPSGPAMTDARAAKLARENRELAGV